MSHTDQDVFFRWVLAPGERLETLRARLGELGEQLLEGARVVADGRCIDVDFGWEFRSQRPLVGAEDAFFEASGALEAIWIRARSGFRADSPLGDDDDVDGINQIDIECDRVALWGWRPCRYGFDEIRVDGAEYWRGAGSYLARNTSRTLLARYEPIPGPALLRAEPIDVLASAPATFARVEWLWRDRVVHAVSTSRDGLCHEAADDWDNCLDDVYLDRFGNRTLLRPRAVYDGDRFASAGEDK